MRVRLANHLPSGPTVCLAVGSYDDTFVALGPALKNESLHPGDSQLVADLSDVVDSVVSFLGAPSDLRETALALAKNAHERGEHIVTDWPPRVGVPFEPRTFRDAALYGRHMTQATKGFLPMIFNQGHIVQAVLAQMRKSLRLPAGLVAKTPYYHGNPTTFVGDNAPVEWPSHCDYLDYELEVAVLITRPVSRRATREEIAAAIGGFVLINDFSARDTQLDEMFSLQFGFVKCKAFATSVASDVVSAEELWSMSESGEEEGKLFGEGLKCQVTVDGQVWNKPSAPPPSTADPSRVCSLVDLIRFCALDEGLVPGELIGLGTVPNCCGLELGQWLQPGNEIVLSVEGLGQLTNTIVMPQGERVNYKDISAVESAPLTMVTRAKLALKMVTMAFIAPYIVFYLLLGGAAAALFWPGPKKCPTEGCEQNPSDQDKKRQ